MRTPKLSALAVVIALTAGMSGLSIAPAFADDAVPPAETVTEQPEAPAPPPAPEPAPAPAPEPEPAPAPAPDPAPEPAPASEPAPAPAPADEVPVDSTEPETPEEPEPALASTLAPLTARTAAGSLPNVTLCHATQGANPWVVITIDEQAAYNGHVAPPNNQNDHLNDIIPAFQYKDKGNTVTYPGKNLTTLFNGIPGSVILANNCAVPTVVTPAASATPQTCSGGVTLVDGRIQLTMLAGVTYTITGPGGVVAYNGSGLSDPVAPGAYSVSFTVAAGYYTSVTSPIPVTVGAFTGPCSRTPVTPAATPTPETCSTAGALVDGRIQLTMLAGVTYTITGPGGVVNYDVSGLSDPVPPGNYSVAFVLDPAYSTAVASPIPVTVDPYSGVCGNTTQVVPAATPSPETCSRLGSLVDGSIQLTMIAGVTYTITGPGGVVNYDAAGLSDPVPAGTYSISYVLDPGLSSGVANPFPVTVDPYAGACIPPSVVTPAAVPTAQSCVANVFLTDGNIQLAVTSGVTYTITGPGGNVPFNIAGFTGPIPPGTYQIGYTLDPGYTSAVPNPFPVTIDAYPTLCDLTTAPLVVPIVTAVPMTCTGDGSYTLANDLADPLAITWTANSAAVSEGTHTVTSPTTVVIDATANGPSYGFAGGQQTSWTLTFQRPAFCDLQTLALTGGSPTLTVLLAVSLVGVGFVLLRMRTSRRRESVI